MKLGILDRAEMRDYRVHRVWIIVECRRRAELPGYRAGLSAARRRMWASVWHLLRRASRAVLRIMAAAWITYIYAVWAIEQAYLQRGYVAYGGEYLIIPFVFCMALKVIGLAERIGHAVKPWVLQLKNIIGRKVKAYED